MPRLSPVFLVNARRLGVALVAGSAAACSSLPRAGSSGTEVRLVPSLDVPGDAASATPHAFIIRLDSVSLRPLPAPEGATGIAIVTTFQGARYHPATVRALGEDPGVLEAVIGAVARETRRTGASGVILDMQAATPEDLQVVASVGRIFRDSASGNGWAPMGFVVPAGDTVGYPTDVVARFASLIVVRLQGEHRSGTSPGPLASPDWIARELGRRVARAGANRVAAELPLFGYLWGTNGEARRVTLDGASQLAAADGIPFRRDPVTGYLTVSSRAREWTIWVPDARTIEILAGAVRRAGVRSLLLAGPDGADPDALRRAAAVFR